MNKSNAMGFVLLVLGTALALTVGTSSSKIALPLGFLGATALVYMGIGLYSRGNTRTGELRTSDDEDRGRSLGRTATYVSTAAAVGALLLFGVATARGSNPLLRLVFGLVFVYNLSASAWLWRSRGFVAGDDGAEKEA